MKLATMLGYTQSNGCFGHCDYYVVIFQVHVCVSVVLVLYCMEVCNSQFQPNARSRNRATGNTLQTSRLYLMNERDRTRSHGQGNTRSYSGNRTANGYTNEDFPNPSDWTCVSQMRWRDLGDLHYPRFIREAVCLASNCFNGFYSCRPASYSLSVLTYRQGRPVTQEEAILPSTLRSTWMFDSVDITVGCECVP
ncbi:TRUNK-like protein [Mya arenaria]|uniref:TRUNK-like protein n=1 Tax=Mya arenaria TaxID=6604 RepID=A0ABY7FM07_MYAAR|nr:TRUNK-like protein [Mya arenaria]